MGEKRGALIKLVHSFFSWIGSTRHLNYNIIPGVVYCWPGVGGLSAVNSSLFHGSRTGNHAIPYHTTG